jgi:transcriptional regulator with XRE-family HTH domain
MVDSVRAEATASEFTASLAATVSTARLERGLSVNVLAHESGVSRAMIAKIEHGEVQPTAALLGRLSGALGMTLSELVAHTEDVVDRLVRCEQQPVWRDPESGYVRRAVSPSASGMLQLVEVELPPRARVSMPMESYLFIDQQIWVLEGHLRFVEGDEVHELDVGDCLQLSEPQNCIFENPTRTTCRYLVALRKR